MKKTQIKLPNTVLENVFEILLLQLQAHSWQRRRATRIIMKDGSLHWINDDWQSGGAARNRIAEYDYRDVIQTSVQRIELMQPNWDKNKLIVKERYSCSTFPKNALLVNADQYSLAQRIFSAIFRHSFIVFPGNSDYDSLAQRILRAVFHHFVFHRNAGKVGDAYGISLNDWIAFNNPSIKNFGTGESTLDALVFTGYQLQTNTVLLKLDYSEHWQEVVDSLLSELRELFPEPKTDENAPFSQEIRALKVTMQNIEAALNKNGAALTQKPAPTDQSGQAEMAKQPPAPPVYDANRERMKQTWEAIKPLVNNGRPNYKKLILYMDEHYPELPHTDDTLRNVIKLGNANKLD